MGCAVPRPSCAPSSPLRRSLLSCVRRPAPLHLHPRPTSIQRPAESRTSGHDVTAQQWAAATNDMHSSEKHTHERTNERRGDMSSGRRQTTRHQPPDGHAPLATAHHTRQQPRASERVERGKRLDAAVSTDFGPARAYGEQERAELEPTRTPAPAALPPHVPPSLTICCMLALCFECAVSSLPPSPAWQLPPVSLCAAALFPLGRVRASLLPSLPPRSCVGVDPAAALPSAASPWPPPLLEAPRRLRSM